MTAVATLSSPNPGNMLFAGVEGHASRDAMTAPRSPIDKVYDHLPQDVTHEDDDLPEPICGGCKKLIDEESADAGVIHFATQLWHVECFRCAKCRNPVTTDRDDILLLSDGHPICGQCNYSCQICNMPIMEEAIMTGDESYHASCFVCRSCQTPIAELVFAKTSQGIYCMKCHNQRVARSRRHAEKKKMAAAAAAAAATGGASPGGIKSPSTPTFNNHGHHSPSANSPSPSSPARREAAGEGVTSDRQTKTDISGSTTSLASLSPFMNSTSSSSLTRPSSAGHGAKRPLHAPVPLGIRNVKKDAPGRPSTAEPKSDASAASTSSNSTTTATGGAQHTDSLQSPLLAGVMEQAAAREKKRQQAERDKSENKLVKQADSSHTSSDNAGLGIGAQPFGSSRNANRSDDQRLSALSVNSQKPSNLTSADQTRLSKAFSFYDADFANLMDSFGRFDSSEEFSLDSNVQKGAIMGRSASAEGGAGGTTFTSDGLSRDAVEEVRDANSTDARTKKRGSEASLSKMSETMRLSLQRARDGQVNMNTVILEGMLDELDATRERMKTLQRKYERIRRASQQAAQGFSSAREEYEQEVQARYDAEAEMLNLKRQLHLQASTLAELATEKRQQETLNRKQEETKNSVQQMERELSKLRIERDVTVAEVAELLALQDGRQVGKDGNEEAIKRSLVARLEGVKEKYRGELESLAMERERLATEVEELRQSRDVFSEETRALNQRNEELSSALTMLQRRVELAQAADNLAVQRPAAQLASARTAGGGSFGFGSGGGKAQTQSQSRTPTSAAGSEWAPHGSAVQHGSEWADQLAVATPIPVTKIEAPPKKFKWMKAPKLTAETARSAGHSLAAAIPGVAPALPSKFASDTQPISPTSSQYPSTQSHASSGANHPTRQGQEQNGSSNGASSGDIVVKEHLFQPFNVLRPVRCFACQKNMWGQSELKCSFCMNACHVRCLQNLPVSCTQPYTGSESATIDGPPMFGRKLSEQVQAEGRSVPNIVTKCVEVVEVQGMDYEGIYRKSGGTSQLKVITQLFEKGQPFNLDDRDRFNDISAITSVLKNYFRELPEPLLTFELHERFVECAEAKNMDPAQREKTMNDLVHALPEAHFQTLKFLVAHLNRVQCRADENRMNSRNLGVVFGPTLMRSADASQEFAHMGGKAMTIEFMIDHPTIFT